MTKYWNPRRIQQEKERKEKMQQRIHEKASVERERTRTYTPGDIAKNTGLMLDALGLSLRRKMIVRLKKDGAMSLSKLAEPFRITLPSALAQVHVLERSGIISTHKRGRIRFCVYNPAALKELGTILSSRPTRLE